MLLRDVLTKEFLEEEYVNKRKFAREIARDVGCSTASVTNYLRRHDIEIEPRYEDRKGYLGSKNPAREVLTKEYLLREYVGKNRSQSSIAKELICSNTLVREALIKHGIEVNKNKNQCFYGEDNISFSNYVTEDKGYLCIRLPNHPKANNRGYVRLHVILAEYFYNTEVSKDEVVHHHNEDKQDNRKENLEIMEKVEHDRYHTTLRHLKARKGT